MEDVRKFLEILPGNGSGYGDEDGSCCVYGYGNGSGYGDGCVYGYGNGSGYGDGSGYGCGRGSGSGYENGSGNGCGRGSGDGIKLFNGFDVHGIDGIQTIITKVKRNVASGFILKSDLTLDKCYIVKYNNVFAHGETLRDAMSALDDKLFDDMEIGERIETFLKEFDLSKKYLAIKFFNWHHKLTGSCDIGRRTFAADMEIDLEHDEYTVAEFINITKNAYQGHIIKALEEAINNKGGIGQ